MLIRLECVRAQHDVTVLDAAETFAVSKNVDEPDPDGTYSIITTTATNEDGIRVAGTEQQLHGWLNRARGQLRAKTSGPRIASVLEAAGARVIAASHAQEAMNRAAAGPPDLLLADIGLPGEDGHALLRRIRTLHPAVPAIALSAYARAADRERALAAGFGDYLIKPVEPAQLVEIVAAACFPEG